MTPEEFNRFSDAIMLPILEKMDPPERKKLLILLRKTVHPHAYQWIDAQLEDKIDNIATRRPVPGRHRQISNDRS